jgi:mxaJ protein
MFSRFLRTSGLFLLALVASHSCLATEIRVCADPDNLPFSNRDMAGFENRIATILARDLNAQLIYVWQRMGRGFVREYIETQKCDLVVGVPEKLRGFSTTRPYYRSTFVFVTRRDAAIHPHSLDDPILRDLRIAVEALDEQYTPPGEALAHRGLQPNLVGYYSIGSHGEDAVQAVAQKAVDVAVIWGPTAGYAAKKSGGLLQLTPIKPDEDAQLLPFSFDISIGVRKSNLVLKEQLDSILVRRRKEIEQLLTSYGLPQLPLPPSKGEQRP